MAIIIHSKDQNLDWARWNIYPDQFVSQQEKKTDNWLKSNMDYFANVAYSQFIKGKDTFVNNYNLMKGILRPQDFYMSEELEDRELKSFTDTLVKSVELPEYVKHYPILNPPINTMVGELSRRPDIPKVKAFDDDSKNEELQFKTEILQQYIIESASSKIRAQMGIQGNADIDEEQVNQLTMEKVSEYLTDYTSLAEKWGNHVLEAMKMQMNMKEISEDCFRDLLICSREFYHIFEKNDKLGVGVENLNPKNVWFLTLPDKKYIKDAFCAGTVHVMELSEIIERFTLSKREIDHLRKGVRELSLFSPRESNFENPNVSGWESIKYDTYSPLIVQQRLLVESMLKENVDPLNDFLGSSSNVNTFGNKYVVVQAYWCSKKKVGRLTYRDEDGVEQVTLVDESYRTVPNQISIEWGYVNQWYKGYKIGTDIYNVEPFDLLDHCPIIGVVHEIKNVNEAKSLVDLLKPYQILYNVCMNQLYKLLEKEIGNVYLMSMRHIPIPKDGDAQDALDIWEEEARKRGVIMVDDSPENLKSPSNYNTFKNIDWTRTSEIQSRYTLAMQLKQEAWELVGISRERTGGVAATQTATGTNTALSQSYAQTESYFAQHEYVLNDVYQSILDAVQTIELKKPYSTISYINTEGEQSFIRVNSEDITMRDLQVFVTSRANDQKVFEDLRALAQPMLQNGATPYEISVLYTTNSVRQMKQVFKSLKDRLEEMQNREQEIKQAAIDQQTQQFQAEIQREDERDFRDKEFESLENELDRLNKKEIALIAASAKQGDGSLPEGNGVDQEVRESARDAAEMNARDREYQIKLAQLQQKSKESNDFIDLELRKIALDKQKIQAQLSMKRMDIRARKEKEKSKPKPKKSSK